MNCTIVRIWDVKRVACYARAEIFTEAVASMVATPLNFYSLYFAYHVTDPGCVYMHEGILDSNPDSDHLLIGGLPTILTSYTGTVMPSCQRAKLNKGDTTPPPQLAIIGWSNFTPADSNAEKSIHV